MLPLLPPTQIHKLIWREPGGIRDSGHWGFANASLSFWRGDGDVPRLGQKVNPFIQSSLEGGIPTRSSSFHHMNKCYFVLRHFKRWRRVVGTPPGIFCQRLSAVTCTSDIIAPFFVTTQHPGFAHRTLGHFQVVRETGREPRTWWQGGLGGQADGSTQQ